MDKVLHPWKKEQGGYLGKGKSGFGYKCMQKVFNSF